MHTYFKTVNMRLLQNTCDENRFQCKRTQQETERKFPVSSSQQECEATNLAYCFKINRDLSSDDTREHFILTITGPSLMLRVQCQKLWLKAFCYHDCKLWISVLASFGSDTLSYLISTLLVKQMYWIF